MSEITLPSVRGKLTPNRILSDLTWLRVGGPADWLFQPADLDDLRDFLRDLPEDVEVFPMGVGSNLIVRDGGLRAVVIRLGRAFNAIEINGDRVRAGAAALDAHVARKAAQAGLDLTFLRTIPGSIGGAVRMNPLAGSQAFVVGVTGMGVHDMGPGSRSGNPRAMHTVPPKAGLQLGHAAGPPGPGSFDRNVLYEGIGQPGLQPRSLFAAQLRARTGQSPPAFAGGCGRQPVQAPVVPRRAPAPGLLFDSDHLGSVAMPGSGCVDCDVDSTQRNHTPGGQESARLVFKPENWALGLRLRGAAIRTDRMDRLVLQVFPTRAAFRLRVTVGTVELDNQRRKGRGHETHVVTDPLHPNQWNTVVIPRPQITTPEFNTIGLSAVGPESAGEFFLDDVQVVFDRPGGQSLSQPAP